MNPAFRFFLAGRDKSNWEKKAIEKKWTTIGNYPFFHTKLLKHIEEGNNYGICCGHGGLIVLDFDDWDYYKQVRDRLPHTFTVKTANKRTYHLYYYLKGEMIKKIGVDVSGKRVCDIQAQGSGVIGPESRYNRSYYTIKYNQPIATISLETLIKVFKIRPKTPRKYIGSTAIDSPKAVLNALKVLEHLKVERTQERHFKCPFHASQGGKCLHLFNNAGLYCFHCSRHWNDIQDFVDDLLIWRENGNHK